MIGARIGDPVEGWILLSISTGKESSLRVYVWRQLRKLGAIYLHQSVCLVPDRPGIRARLRPVLSRIDSHGGQLRLLSIRVDTDEHQRLVDEQQHDRDTEADIESISALGQKCLHRTDPDSPSARPHRWGVGP